jgi:hypothetical protein
MLCVCVCLCGAGVWTLGLHLESLHEPYFCEELFKIGSYGTICPGWLWTVILLIFASQGAKMVAWATITGTEWFLKSVIILLQFSCQSLPVSWAWHFKTLNINLCRMYVVFTLHLSFSYDPLLPPKGHSSLINFTVLKKKKKRAKRERILKG